MYKIAYEDLDTYLRIFSKRALITAELMRIVLEKFHNELLITELDYPTVKDVYEIVADISYKADQDYQQEKGICDPPVFIDFDCKKDDLFAEMRTLLREEVQKYFGEHHERNQ